MDYDFVDVNTEGAENVNGGTGEVIFAAPKSWFETISVPEAPFTDPGDEITIKTAHVFKAGKGFVQLQAAPQKNKLGIKTKGDIGSNGLNSEAEFFVAGSKIAVHEQFRKYLNTPLVTLHTDANCGANMVYQLGCDCLSAWMTFDFDTATTKDGSKGFMGKITYDDGALFYGADIALKP